MLISKFPNINWLKRQIQHQFQNKKGPNGVNLPFEGWPTVLLNTTTKETVREDREGPLSIFMNLQGPSIIGVEKPPVLINENAYVLTNNKAHYDLIIQNNFPTEVFNIHFGTQFLKEASYWFYQTQQGLLDNPFESNASLPTFSLKATWRNATFNQLAYQLQQLYQNKTSSSEIKETALLALFEHILLKEQSQARLIQSIKSSKKSTKEELVKRLYLAVDYIYAFYNQPINLDELAQISCLSKYHFLRSFKQVFGLAPYQFIQQIRFRQAIHLLENSRATLQEIADTIGLENASSLSRMFFRTSGAYPSAYRKRF
jgi:AraC family transcriptional regulator